MTVTADTFRQSFAKAFFDENLYPDETIQFWLAIAVMMLPQNTWGPPGATAVTPPTALADYGAMLFTAHQIVLEKQAGDAAKRGGTPGAQKGAIAGDAVSSISRNYDTSAGLELGAGHWNLTTYGTRFKRLADMVGTGMVTIGGGGWPGPFSQGGGFGTFPWIGPNPAPGNFG